jgi:hypothetical protein
MKPTSPCYGSGDEFVSFMALKGFLLCVWSKAQWSNVIAVR